MNQVDRKKLLPPGGFPVLIERNPPSGGGSYFLCSLIRVVMVKRRLTRRDQAGLPQPDRAGLLASADGARDTHAARETTVAGAPFFVLLSHIVRCQYKRCISHKLQWVRAHAMADHSSPDQRARRGADTQRVVYARAPLQVRWVGRTTTSMYCDTNVSKLLARLTSNNYIQCLLPQPFVPACPMPCPCLCKRSVCACLPYLLCLHRFEFLDFCVRSSWWACTRASKLVHACALLLCDIK